LEANISSLDQTLIKAVNEKHKTFSINQEKSAARFCRQVAAWVPDMFSNCYLARNHKTANNSTTAEAIEKNKDRFKILKILECFCVFLNTFETFKFYFIKSATYF